MAATEEAWRSGELGEAQVGALAGLRRRVGGDLFDGAEADPVGHARTLSLREFGRVLAYWLQAVDADGVEADAQSQRQSRRLQLSRSPSAGCGSPRACSTPSAARP